MDETKSGPPEAVQSRGEIAHSATVDGGGSLPDVSLPPVVLSYQNRKPGGLPMPAITLNEARSIISKTFERGLDMGLKPLSVCVLDAGGHLKAFERQDGASNLRFRIAHGKAFGAIGLGVGSRALMNRAESQSYFILAANGAFDGNLVPVPGGVLVKEAGGDIIGAVGVTGDTSDNDEAAAVAAIEAVGYVADTG